MTSLQDFSNAISRLQASPSLATLSSVYDQLGGSFKFEAGVTPLSEWSMLFYTLAIYLIVSYTLSFILGQKSPQEKSDSKSLYPQILHYISIIHNFNMTLISFVCCVGLLFEAGSIVYNYGMYASICDPEHKHNTGKAVFWIYIYYLSKYVELFDTVLLVLRRSQLRFIHSYHHVTTMFITFCGLAFHGTGQWFIIWLNVLVHVVLYYYYLQVTLKRPVPWKMRVTDLQLVQFLLDICAFSYYIYADILYERPRGRKCTGSLVGAIFSDLIVASFFFLFYRLRQANARREQKTKKIE